VITSARAEPAKGERPDDRSNNSCAVIRGLHILGNQIATLTQRSLLTLAMYRLSYSLLAPRRPRGCYLVARPPARIGVKSSKGPDSLDPPRYDSYDAECSEKDEGISIEASGDAPPILEAVDCPLDDIALPVEACIVRIKDLAVSAWRDDRLTAELIEPLA
jgi:hypothetical protein